MFNVIIRCPTTGRLVHTGILVELDCFDFLSDVQPAPPSAIIAEENMPGANTIPGWSLWAHGRWNLASRIASQS
jgi:hypothetical protein